MGKKLVGDDVLRPRQRQKRETADRVLNAAREMFAEVGFERTTIRGIAKRAGVSTGSVMAHYQSKIALLFEMLEFVNSRQLAMVQETMPPSGPVADRIMHLVRVYAAFDLEHPSLAAAVLGYSWQWTDETEARVRRHFARGDEFLHDLLKTGVMSGELADDLDIHLSVKMIFALYTRNLRDAIFDKLGAADMAARFEPQLVLLCRGMSRR